MSSIESYVFSLPRPPLASLETYHQLGRVREHMTFTHGDGFSGRLELHTDDGRAHAWAVMTPQDKTGHENVDYAEKITSKFEGTLSDSPTITQGWPPDAISNLEQDMEFYLRTMTEVMAVAEPHLEQSWARTKERWQAASDVQHQPHGSSGLPRPEQTAGFIPVEVTLDAQDDGQLRRLFVEAAFEAVSPWAR